MCILVQVQCSFLMLMGSCIVIIFQYINPNKMCILVQVQSSFLMFMGSCIVIIFQYINPNKMCVLVQVQCSFLMFIGPCIVIIFQYINPNQMHMSQSLFYLTIALHVSGVTIAHIQEHKTTVTTASGNRYTVIDSVKCNSVYCSESSSVVQSQRAGLWYPSSRVQTRPKPLDF